MRRRAFSFSVPPNFIPHGGLRGAGLCANMMRKHKQNPYEEVPMKKKTTFEDYRKALSGVGDATKERILADADKHLDALELARLVRIAYPEPV